VVGNDGAGGVFRAALGRVARTRRPGLRVRHFARDVGKGGASSESHMYKWDLRLGSMGYKITAVFGVHGAIAD
jgi:hypothetical protein